MKAVNQSVDVLNGFMREFIAQTKVHPHLSSISLFCVNDIPVVAFDVFPVDGHIWIEDIQSLQNGGGYGSMALDWLCSLADKHKVEIRGEIYPPQGGRLDADQLIAWYRRRDFKVNGRKMCREPKEAKP